MRKETKFLAKMNSDHRQWKVRNWLSELEAVRARLWRWKCKVASSSKSWLFPLH